MGVLNRIFRFHALICERSKINHCYRYSEFFYTASVEIVIFIYMLVNIDKNWGNSGCIGEWGDWGKGGRGLTNGLKLCGASLKKSGWCLTEWTHFTLSSPWIDSKSDWKFRPLMVVRIPKYFFSSLGGEDQRATPTFRAKCNNPNEIWHTADESITASLGLNQANEGDVHTGRIV